MAKRTLTLSSEGREEEEGHLLDECVAEVVGVKGGNGLHGDVGATPQGLAHLSKASGAQQLTQLQLAGVDDPVLFLSDPDQVQGGPTRVEDEEMRERAGPAYLLLLTKCQEKDYDDDQHGEEEESDNHSHDDPRDGSTAQTGSRGGNGDLAEGAGPVGETYASRALAGARVRAYGAIVHTSSQRAYWSTVARQAHQRIQHLRLHLSRRLDNWQTMPPESLAVSTGQCKERKESLL